MRDVPLHSLSRPLRHQVRGNRWGNNASAMLEPYTTGLAFDLKNDEYAFKEAGDVHTMGVFSIDFASKLPNGVAYRPLGLYFDATTYMKDIEIDDLVPGLTSAAFTLMMHIHNANNTTGTQRMAYSIANSASSQKHVYDFCQASQTRSHCASTGAVANYARFNPSNIASPAITETKRGISFAEDDTQMSIDGSLSGGADSSCDIIDLFDLRFGANDESGGKPLLATIQTFLLFNGAVSDADLNALTAL